MTNTQSCLIQMPIDETEMVVSSIVENVVDSNTESAVDFTNVESAVDSNT